MREEIKKEILLILRQTSALLKKNDFVGMRGLSNNAVEQASVFQDEDSLSIAVMIYALSVMCCRHQRLAADKVIASIEDGHRKLLDGDDEGYHKEIKHLFQDIEKADSKLRFYIQEVINKSKINKGSNLYAHGLSVDRVASLMDLSHWELMHYIGKTMVIDTEKEARAAGKRIEFARGLFR